MKTANPACDSVCQQARKGYSAPSYSAAQQAYIAAAQNAVGADGYASQPAAQLLKDGSETCTALKGGISESSLVNRANKSRRKLARDMTDAALRHLCPGAVRTIEYVVTGTPGADVTRACRV